MRCKSPTSPKHTGTLGNVLSNTSRFCFEISHIITCSNNMSAPGSCLRDQARFKQSVTMRSVPKPVHKEPILIDVRRSINKSAMPCKCPSSAVDSSTQSATSSSRADAGREDSGCGPVCPGSVLSQASQAAASSSDVSHCESEAAAGRFNAAAGRFNGLMEWSSPGLSRASTGHQFLPSCGIRV